jgi:hemolysin activation/secretion protein
MSAFAQAFPLSLARILPFTLSLFFLFLPGRQGVAQAAEAAGTARAAATKVHVEKIKVTGAEDLDSVKIDHLIAAYIGKDLGLTDLQSLADSIAEAYRKYGYTLATAYIPPQDIVDGTVEIALMAGTVGEIVVTSSGRYNMTFIREAFGPVAKEAAFKQSALERSLLLLNEYPNLKAAATLRPGKKPGSTDIIVDVNDGSPIRASLDDNYFSSQFVARHLYGIGVDVTNTSIPWLVRGSTLSLRELFNTDPRFAPTDRLYLEPKDGYYSRSISYTAPLNSYGTKVGMFFSYGVFDLGGQLAFLDTKGMSRNYGFSFTHPFIKSRLENLNAELGFEVKDTTMSLLNIKTSDDRIRFLKAGLSYEKSDTTGRSLASVYVFRGLNGILGGMKENDPLSSRQGADGLFTRGLLSLGRVQRLSNSFTLLLRGVGQYSPDSLVVSEQFGAGGPDTVRGYPMGKFLGDRGYSASAELAVAPWANKDIAQWAFFVDHGAVGIKDPAVGQKGYYALTGVGTGFRLNVPSLYSNLQLRFDVGLPLKLYQGLVKEQPAYYFQAAMKF